MMTLNEAEVSVCQILVYHTRSLNVQPLMCEEPWAVRQEIPTVVYVMVVIAVQLLCVRLPYLIPGRVDRAE